MDLMLFTRHVITAANKTDEKPDHFFFHEAIDHNNKNFVPRIVNFVLVFFLSISSKFGVRREERIISMDD